MTRKDYLMLSRTLREVRRFYAQTSPDVVRGVDATAQAIAARLHWDNAAFDKQRFLVDAGVTNP